MIDYAKHPTIDPVKRVILPETRVDDAGKPICVYCDKRLRWNTGWGYEGAGLFCTMKCAATWANFKASAGSESE